MTKTKVASSHREMLHFGSYDRYSWPTACSYVHTTLGSFIAHLEATFSSINWLSDYCKSLFALGLIHRPLFEFKHICVLPEVPRHTLSAIYKSNLAHSHSTLPTFTKL